MNNNKLFLLDAYALIYRAYYAFIKIHASIPKDKIRLLFWFCEYIGGNIWKENPTHIAVVLIHLNQVLDI